MIEQSVIYSVNHDPEKPAIARAGRAHSHSVGRTRCRTGVTEDRNAGLDTDITFRIL